MRTFMQVGYYLHDFGGEERCIVLSAGRMSALNRDKEYYIIYNEDDGSPVNIKDKGEKIDEKKFSSKIHVEKSFIDSAISLKNEGIPSHLYIDMTNITLIISFKEYEWLG